MTMMMMTMMMMMMKFQCSCLAKFMSQATPGVIETYRLSSQMIQPQQAAPTDLLFVTSYNMQENTAHKFYNPETIGVNQQKW